MSDGGSIPGWYPDPWRPGWLRWWDGRAWTGHDMPGGGAPPAGGVGAAADEAAGDERRLLPWARAAVIAWPLLIVAAAVNNVFAGHRLRLLYDWFHTTMAHAGTPGYVPPPAPHVSAVAYIGLAAWLPRIAFAVWLHRSAVTARARAYPARLNPALGGFSVLIPVVDLWMPAQCMMGCLPPEHPLRGRVPWFWALYDVAGLAGSAVAVVSAFSQTAGLAALVPLAAAYVVLLFAALAFVSAVDVDHHPAVPA